MNDEKNNFMTIKIRQLIYTIIIGDYHNDKKYIEYIHIIFCDKNALSYLQNTDFPAFVFI